MARLFRPDRPLVRPWALAGPVIVLMLLAPLLRPLRAPGRASAPERVTLEAVRAVLHDGTLALDPRRLMPGDPTLPRGQQQFAQDPPAFDAILAAVGWGIERFGVRSDRNPHLFAYLLTLFAIALPTAVSGGLIYRTSRAFQLLRPVRFALALTCVLATGWLTAATTLRPSALATAGVMASIMCVVQFAYAKRPGRAVGWMMLAGAAGATAMVIEPMAAWALVAVVIAGAAARVKRRWRVFGLILAVAGAAGPVALHLTLNTAITGDWRPPRWHVMTPPAVAVSLPDEDDDTLPSNWTGTGRAVGRVLTLTVGEHGLFSHFPVLVLGLAGAGLIVRRHWTGSLKVLAGMTLLSIAGALLYKANNRFDAIDAGFAAPRLGVFAPALMLWAGAWLRRRHGPVVWTATGVALAISIAATLIGALAASPDGYSHYTLAEAVERLLR